MDGKTSCSEARRDETRPGEMDCGHQANECASLRLHCYALTPREGSSEPRVESQDRRGEASGVAAKPRPKRKRESAAVH